MSVDSSGVTTYLFAQRPSYIAHLAIKLTNSPPQMHSPLPDCEKGRYGRDKVLELIDNHQHSANALFTRQTS